MDPKIEQLEEGNKEDEYHEFPKKGQKIPIQLLSK